MLFCNPMILFRPLNEPTEPQLRKNGVMFRLAVVRCRDHIKKHILPCFPDDLVVADAVTALDYLVTQGTGSGMPWGRSFCQLSDRISAARRSSSDPRFMCAIFNRYAPLDDSDISRLRPVLHTATSAAVNGAYVVVQYLKDMGVELKTPRELLPFEREVWLRDCRKTNL